MYKIPKIYLNAMYDSNRNNIMLKLAKNKENCK